MTADLLTHFWMGGVLLFGFVFFALSIYLTNKSTANQSE
jgi:hypothetical protein